MVVVLVVEKKGGELKECYHPTYINTFGIRGQGPTPEAVAPVAA